jgi:hypothetical protein
MLLALRAVFLDGESWFPVQVVDEDSVHVLPGNDLIEHLLSDDCVCGPVCEPLPHDDGTFSWHYLHSSFDGREDDEE